MEIAQRAKKLQELLATAGIEVKNGKIAKEDLEKALEIAASIPLDKALYESQADTEDEISLVWSTDDVLSRAAERKINLSKDEARSILKDIEDNHNANVGVNWDVIDAQTDHYLGEKKTRTISSSAKLFKFSQLTPEAQKVAVKDYLDGWLETHPDEKDEVDLEWAREGCQDTEDEVMYTEDGMPSGEDPPEDETTATASVDDVDLEDLFNGIDNTFITLISETDSADKKKFGLLAGMSVDAIDSLNDVVKKAMEEAVVPGPKDLEKIKAVLAAVPKMEFNKNFTGDEEFVSKQYIDDLLKALAEIS
jgi:hypothetical protein